MIKQNILNINRNYNLGAKLFLSQELGLVDTINVYHPELIKIRDRFKQLEWSENEFHYENNRNDIKSMNVDELNKFITILAWQWHADSVAANNFVNILMPFVSSTELQEPLYRLAANESIHSKTYSEAVKNLFPNPTEILDRIIVEGDALRRIEVLTKIYSSAKKVAGKLMLDETGTYKNSEEVLKTLYLLLVSNYVLERVQFPTSFAYTFSLAKTGLVSQFGNAVRKIAQDELTLHVRLGYYLLNHLVSGEYGNDIISDCKRDVIEIVNSVLDCELKGIDYLFKNNSDSVGLNKEMLKQYALYCFKPVYQYFKIDYKIYNIDLPDSNPLPFMDDWLSDTVQDAPQENKTVTKYFASDVRQDSTEMIIETPDIVLE